METIGAKIYKLRKTIGLSQEELAEKARISRQTVYKWESDSVQPSSENIATLCAVLGVSRDYFYIDNTPNTNIKNDEVALTSEKIRNNRKLIIGIIINSVILALLIIVTVVVGLMTISTNTGDAQNTSISIDYGSFLFSLSLTIIAIVSDAVLIVRLIKKKRM